MPNPPYIGLNMSEADRINVVGTQALLGNKVGILIEGESQDPGKMERFIAKILEKFPGVEVTFKGPYFKDQSVMAVVFERKKD